LPDDMNPANFKFRVQLAEYQGSVPQEQLSEYENYGPVDVVSRSGKSYLYMGEFPTLDMAKRFKKELSAEGLKNLTIAGEYSGKPLSEEEFNKLFK
jgi:hypothetical protein